jgi:pimeloyl-ACP methyl ester carboxylesterase
VREIKVPTLILWGGKDRLIPLEFDALGHVPHEEDPARTVEAVLPFMQSGR